MHIWEHSNIHFPSSSMFSWRQNHATSGFWQKKKWSRHLMVWQPRYWYHGRYHSVGVGDWWGEITRLLWELACLHCHGPWGSKSGGIMQAQWNIEENLSHLPKDCSCSRRHCFQSFGLEKHLCLLQYVTIGPWYCTAWDIAQSCSISPQLLFDVCFWWLKSKTWLPWAKHCKSWAIIGAILLWQNLDKWQKSPFVNYYLSIGKICR